MFGKDAKDPHEVAPDVFMFTWRDLNDRDRKTWQEGYLAAAPMSLSYPHGEPRFFGVRSSFLGTLIRNWEIATGKRASEQ